MERECGKLDTCSRTNTLPHREFSGTWWYCLGWSTLASSRIYLHPGTRENTTIAHSTNFISGRGFILWSTWRTRFSASNEVNDHQVFQAHATLSVVLNFNTQPLKFCPLSYLGDASFHVRSTSTPMNHEVFKFLSGVLTIELWSQFSTKMALPGECSVHNGTQQNSIR